MRRWPAALLLASCLPLAVHAAELKLTPELCAIGQEETQCQVSVRVEFVAEQPGRYCLHVSHRGLVRCFTTETGEQFQINVSAQENLLFAITEAETREQVTAATLRVARHRPKRHLRNYGWGLL